MGEVQDSSEKYKLTFYQLFLSSGLNEKTVKTLKIPVLNFILHTSFFGFYFYFAQIKSGFCITCYLPDTSVCLHGLLQGLGSLKSPASAMRS